MSAMDKAQTAAAWELAKECMKSYPDAYAKMVAEVAALHTAPEEAEAVMKKLDIMADYHKDDYGDLVVFDMWTPYPNITEITVGDLRAASEWMKKWSKK